MAAFVTVFVVSYILHGIGITVGYHRLLSHRSFRCAKALEYFIVLCGYLAFQGSPAWWSTIHRVHHKNADTDADPHSPDDGWLHAYIGWIRADFKLAVDTICRDIVQDPVYAAVDKIDSLAIPINLAFRGIIWYFFGWQAALANLVASLLVFQIPMILNLFCHLPQLGYKNFNSADKAVNVWWVGILALGEGWHNNHHVIPGSARMGMRKFEFDFSWLVIKLFAFLGLATAVNDGRVQEESEYRKNKELARVQ